MAIILHALRSWRKIGLFLVYYEVEKCLCTREDALSCHEPEHHVLEFALSVVLCKKYSGKSETNSIADRLCDDDYRNSYDPLIRAKPGRRKLSADL